MQETKIILDRFVSEIAAHGAGRYDWTGVYLLDSENRLVLISYIGEPTPHTIIPVDKGICGAAVREGKTLNIPDVSKDSRYLSCSIKTKSEIVVPIWKNGKVVGEIDIDSHKINAFTDDDDHYLTKMAKKIASEI